MTSLMAQCSRLSIRPSSWASHPFISSACSIDIPRKRYSSGKEYRPGKESRLGHYSSRGKEPNYQPWQDRGRVSKNKLEFQAQASAPNTSTTENESYAPQLQDNMKFPPPENWMLKMAKKRDVLAKKSVTELMTERREHFLHLIKKLYRSKYIKQKLNGLDIEPALGVETIKKFSNSLTTNTLKQLPLEDALKAYVQTKNIDRIVLPALYHFIRENISPDKYGLLDTLTRFSDLRTPAEWFPAAREMKRKIYLHVGPTNSGKTYSALKRLEAASTGVYAGPLRLLAHEIYERLNTANHACNLLTGEERKESDGVEKWAATVEMVPLGKRLEVAVVDEIQMISDEQRGWAWTQALLGLQAEEIHLCGEPTAIPLVKRLCDSTGEDVIIKTYERLTPLEIEPKGLAGSFTHVREGDCVVTFSRKNIFALRSMIEKTTQLKAAVIYGNLPPETRAEQAKLFNTEGSGYDVLIASDAIGMGLNLNIRRVIFETLSKFNGKSSAPLSVSQVKQIAGRAGRFNTRFSTGHVTTLKDEDLKRLKTVLAIASAPPLESAGLYPKLEQIEAFAKELPNESLSGLLDKFEDLARLDGDFFLCNLESQKRIADLIEPLNLTLRDKYTLVSAPANVEDPFMSSIALRFARDLSAGNECSIRNIVHLPAQPPPTSEALRDLEGTHKAIILYLWLSFRFPTVFTQTDIAMYLKERTETLINTSLSQLHSMKKKYRQVLEDGDVVNRFDVKSKKRFEKRDGKSGASGRRDVGSISQNGNKREQFAGSKKIDKDLESAREVWNWADVQSHRGNGEDGRKNDSDKTAVENEELRY
ncbi:P-loop containing nucleoside triphosphate hydrolase protein [Chytridium lagenaria]|nr:P-loop containing nucleoside triphosphate hydrolase protein [Chytridium lagenaria]